MSGRGMTLIAVLLVAVGLGGCMHDTTPPVALVDLDAVARQLGRSDTMAAELKAYNEELSTELKAQAAELKEQLETSLQALSANPTQEGRARHQQMMTQAARTLEESKRQAQQKAVAKRTELVVAFRREARPAVEKVAREKGMKMVLTTADNVVWADRTLDITSEVLAALGGPKTN